MNNWNDTAQEQSRYGNNVPERKNQTPTKLGFQATRSFNVGASVKLGVTEYGHMAFLKKLGQDSQEVLVITAFGEVIRGQIKTVDEQTVSLKCENKGSEGLEVKQGYRTRILFKTHIAEISPVRGIENLADKLEKKGTIFGSSQKSLSTGFLKTEIVPC